MAALRPGGCLPGCLVGWILTLIGLPACPPACLPLLGCRVEEAASKARQEVQRQREEQRRYQEVRRAPRRAALVAPHSAVWLLLLKGRVLAPACLLQLQFKGLPAVQWDL